MTLLLPSHTAPFLDCVHCRGSSVPFLLPLHTLSCHISSRGQAREDARSAAGQLLTDADHENCYKYVFSESVEQRPTVEQLRQKAAAARAAVDSLAEQHACASCDMLVMEKDLTAYSLQERPDAIWGPLSDELLEEGELHPQLRDQYRLTEYADDADGSWSEYMLSPLSIFAEDGVSHIRLCHTCSAALGREAVPKLAIRNSLWIGKFTRVLWIFTRTVHINLSVLDVNSSQLFCLTCIRSQVGHPTYQN